MFSCIIIITILLIISYKFNKIYENNIINIVLSKLEYIPKYYKIIRKKNRIIIKCHHYSNTLYANIEYKDIRLSKKSNDNSYHSYYKSLDNYDINKTFSIVIYDIIIDLTNKNYKIIISYFTIINCINDLLYNKLIEKLNNKSYYIQINNLNFINDEEYNFEPIRRKTYIYNYPTKINDNSFKLNNPIKLNNIIIIIIVFNDNYKCVGISNTIDTKPHIYNNYGTIRINKITGYFI